MRRGQGLNFSARRSSREWSCDRNNGRGIRRTPDILLLIHNSIILNHLSPVSLRRAPASPHFFTNRKRSRQQSISSALPPSMPRRSVRAPGPRGQATRGGPELGALPPDLRDLTPYCHPRRPAGAGQPHPEPGLAPQSALRLHPCRAIPSAPVSTGLGSQRCFAKRIVVVHREI